MKISVELSLYPLADNYIPAIDRLLAALHEAAGIEVRTNGMSTQIFGDYNPVMELLQSAMKQTMESEPKVAIVAKFLNTDVSEYVHKR